MANVTVYGPPQSTYVRTARIALEEKGVAYELGPVEFGQPSHLALHPFAKIPAFTHGDVHLYETIAITTYINDAFKGAALLPADPAARARAFQWISVTNDYIYGIAIRDLVIERFVKPMRGGTPDEALIARNKPTLLARFDIVDKALQGSSYLAGEYSLADMFLLPIVAYLPALPEGREVLARCRNIDAWLKRVMARPAVTKTAPPVPQAAE